MSSTSHRTLSPTAAGPKLRGILRGRAARKPRAVAYTFLSDGEAEETNLTYGELDEQARAVAAMLQAAGAAGQRVLLLYPSGLEYVCAFFGCLYAGAVAVPAYPPKLNRSLHRLQAVVGLAGVSALPRSASSAASAPCCRTPGLRSCSLDTDDLGRRTAESGASRPSTAARLLPPVHVRLPRAEGLGEARHLLHNEG